MTDSPRLVPALVRGGLLLALAALTSGCIFEVWAGAYGVKQQGKTTAGYGLGASSGFYLDPTPTRTRIAFSEMVDKTYDGSGQAKALEQTGWSEARLDYTYARSHSYQSDQERRVSAVVGWGNHSGVVTLRPPAAPERNASAWMVFVGYTRAALLGPGKVWEDQASYSVGPAVVHWDSPTAGQVEAVGAQVRLTVALSPLGLVGVAAGMASAAGESHGGSGGSTTTTTTTTTTQPQQRGNAGCYYQDHCDVDGHCTTRWVCP